MFILVACNSHGSKHVEFLHFPETLKLMESLKFLIPNLSFTLQITQIVVVQYPYTLYLVQSNSYVMMTIIVNHWKKIIKFLN